VDPMQETLLHVSSVLLVPVVAILLFLLATSFLELGSFLRELVDRRRGLVARVDRFAAFARDRAEEPRETVTELDRIEKALTRRIDRNTIVSRIGPMLGLAGTLIPLGPALHELTKADFSLFADKIVVAFTTTVAGLVVCAIRFVVGSIRARWYEEDLRAMEALAGGPDA